jgi:hypothetical protein
MTDYPIAGTWQMVHDNWTGTLVLSVALDVVTRVAPPCQFTFHRLHGTYTPGAGGVPLAVVGRVGGRDPWRRNDQCPSADHGLAFSIAFAGTAPQQFKGYFFTQAGPGHLAGVTWWQDIPFGWFATRV